jgi:GT2 family glycosyltransferase
MIYIIIPVHNRLGFTVSCVESLARQTYRGFRVVIVDDGSSDGTAYHIRAHYPDIVLLKGDGHLWWTGALNLAVQKILSMSSDNKDYILTLNNDLVVGPDYLKNLLTVAEQNDDAIIGSVSVHIDDPEHVHFAGTEWNSTTAKYRSSLKGSRNYSRLKRFQTLDTDLLPGRGILIPVSVFRKLGLYDNRAFPHYMADEDFSMRARKAGYRLLIATQAAVLNHVSATGIDNKRRSLRYFIDVLTSIKSPSNIRNRWHWAWRHATIYPPLYFIADMLRIFKGMLINHK